MLGKRFKRLGHQDPRKPRSKAFVFELVGESVNNEKLARQLDMCLVDGKRQRIIHYLWMGTGSLKG
jgi:hypothetical protein